jgi:hypothetical protein
MIPAMLARPTAIQVPTTGILAAAEAAPNVEAMRHKRRGQWRSWSRADISSETADLATALQERGIGGRSIVAASGDYAPALLLFAIAAARTGARVISVPTGVTAVDLGAWLRDESIALAFVGLRQQLETWRAALREAERETEIVVDLHLPWGHAAAVGVTAASEMLGDAARGREAARQAGDLLWIEEGSDWTDGLGFLLQALARGTALAFPENRIAAGRDRREIQPARFALSATHRVALARDLANRLPVGHSLTSSLTRKALSAGRHGSSYWHQRWLRGRIRRSFGLSHLSELTVVGAPDASPEASDPADLFSALGIRAGRVEPPGSGLSQLAQSPLAFA